MKKGVKVVAVGAVLWDIIGENEYIGGAPFNFAVNMARLGAEAVLVTSVGRDVRGERAVNKIGEFNVSDRFVQISAAYGTGFAKATLDSAGNATYDIPRAAFDDIRADDGLIDALNSFRPDVIYFGSFEQRYSTTREAVARILAEVKAPHVFFDVNIRMDFKDKDVLSAGLKRSTIVKLNEDEYALISELFYGRILDEQAFAHMLCRDFDIECLIITLGEKGCRVYNGGRVYNGKPVPAKNGDTIGAGDAFSGAFVASYLSGEGVVSAADKGNILGSYVAGRSGALPEFDEEIIAKLNQNA